MSMYGEIITADGEIYSGEEAGWRRGGRLQVKADTIGPSMTKQEFVDECDINNIMSTYQKTGMLNHVNQYGGEYSDVTGAVSFHEAQNIVLEAQNAFMSVPSSVRAQFDNDPGKFLDFVNNPENKDKMREMGLLKEKHDGREVEGQNIRSVDTGKPDGTLEGPIKERVATGGDKRKEL